MATERGRGRARGTGKGKGTARGQDAEDTRRTGTDSDATADQGNKDEFSLSTIDAALVKNSSSAATGENGSTPESSNVAPGPSTASANDLFSRMDSNGDGYITREEFEAWQRASARNNSLDLLKADKSPALLENSGSSPKEEVNSIIKRLQSSRPRDDGNNAAQPPGGSLQAAFAGVADASVKLENEQLREALRVAKFKAQKEQDELKIKLEVQQDIVAQQTRRINKLSSELATTQHDWAVDVENLHQQYLTRIVDLEKRNWELTYRVERNSKESDMPTDGHKVARRSLRNLRPVSI